MQRRPASTPPAESGGGRSARGPAARSEGAVLRRRAVPSLPADPEEARDLLLSKAEECFERYGITRTTMDDIADAAKVSRPTLYRYFGDREALIREIAMRRSRMLHDRAHRFLETQPTFPDRLVEGLLYLAEKGRKDQFYRLLMRPETITIANEVLMDPEGQTVQFYGELWEPVLSKAAAAGELREGLDLKAAYHWLAYVNFVLVGWLDLDPRNVEWHRSMLRQFVVPAFVAEGGAPGRAGTQTRGQAAPSSTSRARSSRRGTEGARSS